MIHSRVQSIKTRLHEILEAGHTGDRVSMAVDVFLVTLILLNVCAFAAETVDHIAQKHGAALHFFNLISVVIFTIEYFLRLWVCVEIHAFRKYSPLKARLKFATRPLLIIDFLAIAPFYLSAFFGVDLRVLRILRMLRFLKLARYSPALQTLAKVFVNERRALLGAALIMIFLIILASTIMYFLENKAQPEKFASLPHSIWWAIATLSTVGYGDVTPVTAAGKAVAGVFMLFGFAMYALPVGILATGFSQEISKRQFVVTWSMVSNVPFFSKMSAQLLSRVVTRLRSESYEQGEVILSDEDEVRCLYLIAKGEVKMITPSKTVTLKQGDFFGERALIDESLRIAKNVVALTPCDLLLLDKDDFHELRQREPDIQYHFNKVGKKRGSYRAQTQKKGEKKRR